MSNTKVKVQSQYLTGVPWVISALDGEYFRTISRHLVIVVKLSIFEMCCLGRKQITPSTVNHTLSKMFGGISVLRYLRISRRGCVKSLAHYMAFCSFKHLPLAKDFNFRIVPGKSNNDRPGPHDLLPTRFERLKLCLQV